MPAPLSIIIPTLNAEEQLPSCFASLSEGIDQALIAQVIVVDGGSSDATCKIADAWGADVVKVDVASRGGQLRHGAEIAKAPSFLFLHADTILSSGWPQVVMQQLGHGPACFRLAFRTNHIMGKITAGWANLRTRLFGLPYGDQGLLVSAVDYADAGGFPDQPLMEDVALVRALPRVALMNATAMTGAGKYHRDGWVRRGAHNISLLLRYLLGADPRELAKRY